MAGFSEHMLVCAYGWKRIDKGIIWKGNEELQRRVTMKSSLFERKVTSVEVAYQNTVLSIF